MRTLTILAALALAAPLCAADPPKLLPKCQCGDACKCKPGACPLTCPTIRDRFVDSTGTLVEQGADGVYRAVPGAPKGKPTYSAASPASLAPALPASPFTLTPGCVGNR